MKVETAKRLIEPFDSGDLKQLKGMTYVPIAEVVNRCNGVLGVGNWRPEVLRTEAWGSQDTQYGPCPVHIVATVRVHVKDPDTGEWTWADGMGGQDVVFFKDRNLGPTNLGDAYKGACSDATKKALQHFGVGLELARDGQPSETFEPTFDLTDEITIVDEAGAPRFSDREKAAIKAEWKKRRFGFKLSEVPESRVQEIKTFLTSFEGTDVPTESEGNAQERSGEAAAVDLPGYEAPMSETEAKDKIAGCFAKLLPKQQDQRREAFDIWQESGYQGIDTVGAVEWGILMSFTKERIEQLLREKAA